MTVATDTARLWDDWLKGNNEQVRRDIMQLASADTFLLRDACPPNTPGVYMFLVDSEIKYVGFAKGNGGLSDRIMSKHLAGSDAHTLQRAFKHAFPDRQERREFLRNHISVKWVAVDDSNRVPTIERILIQMLQPDWNLA